MEHAFRTALQRALWRSLRANGFAGSGNTLRRVTLPVVHVFNIQGDRYGGGCYLNLGAHLAYLPAEGGGNVAVADLLEYHCVFRDRVVPAHGPSHPWAYLEDPTPAQESIEFALEALELQAKPFFARYGSYPKSFATLVAESDPSSVHGRDALTYSRIALDLQLKERAMEFIEAGLRSCPERATLLRDELLDVQSRATAA